MLLLDTQPTSPGREALFLPGGGGARQRMARRSLPPPVRFSFDGLYASALPGETLLQALSRKGVPLLSRSIKYHRPRGPLCGIGQCAGCLVRVNGVPNTRACRTVPQEGDRVEGENAWPSVRRDLFGIFDRMFPVHLDTLHGFRRPLFLRPAYHRVVRRLAGTGRLPDPTEGLSPPARTTRPWTTEVLVVGGGRAGSRAALRLARGPGAPKVLLLERATTTSLDQEKDLPLSLQVRTGASLVFLPSRPDPEAPFVGLVELREGGAVQVRASRVVLATGGYDAFLVFRGNDRPGVLTGDAALALRPLSGGAPPFSRALLWGGGERAKKVLQELPGSFAAVAAPGPLDPSLAELARSQRLDVRPNHLLLSTVGSRSVKGAVVADRKSGEQAKLPVDAIVLAHRRVPNVPLLFQAGATMHWRGGTGAYYPEIAPSGLTSVSGLFVVGELAGFLDPVAADASADRAADALGTPTGGTSPSESQVLGARVPLEPDPAFSRYYLELLRTPGRGKRVVCPCEDVVLEEVDEAVHDGFTGTEVIKRYTGAGTGVCQGRYCLPDVVLLLSLFEGRPPAEVGFITQRPPVWPVRLGDLAALSEESEPPTVPTPAGGPA